ncbi:amino acid ABC transporter permease [Paenarthrobacter sp. TYUT067]|uniref:amino acid ABC transporter permease n=1 Tax=Paenarthrobacter sp. TYUT067 TaxID=2926245 RepID=UPI00202E439F|nr:amino acid ABC transporter permease [Paenarthrobacter sp. TYUT067]MCM0616886.1 amino acid ABC transporter permease [Paenarthrobacter sp. TYUT067]
MDLITQWLSWLPNLAPGLSVSLQLTGLALLIGFPFGLLLAVMAEAKFLPFQWISFAFVEIGRGLPALVLLYLLYFSLPDAGITLTSLTTAIIALSWNTGAYASEYFRAGLAAVPLGQKEAAITSGLSGWTGFRIVILPQALRISTPPLAGLAVLVFQGSALAFVIAVPELMSKAFEIGSITFEYLSVYTLTAVVYGSLTLIFLGLVRLLELRLGRHLLRN